MGITRSSAHKRRNTGAKKHPLRKKRKYELGRPPANTKMGTTRVKTIRCMGGNLKYRAIRLEAGNFSWGTEVCTRKTRILDVVYNASNNELVRTKTLVKGAILQIDATPFRQWYESHYGLTIGMKKAKKAETSEEVTAEVPEKKLSEKKRIRQENRTLEPMLEEQLSTGKILACISSRPGQVGRADGYILEGKELEFYHKMIVRKKGKH